MLTQAVLGTDNKEVQKIDLPELLFGAPVRRQLLFNTAKDYLANKRQGTVQAKFRGEVKGSTRKIYKQKGTGNARHGGIRANIFVGGGIAFPPRPRNWFVKISKNQKTQALCSALSLRLKEGNLILVDCIPCETIKTKPLVQQLARWGLTKCLLVVEEPIEKLWKSMRNIPHVGLATSNNLNALDVLKFEKILLTKQAIHVLEKRLL